MQLGGDLVLMEGFEYFFYLPFETTKDDGNCVCGGEQNVL